MAREYTREIYLYINGKQVKNDIKSIREEMKLLTNEQAKMTVGSKEYVAAGEKIRLLKGVLNEHNAQLKTVTRNWKTSMNAIGDWFNRFQAVGVALIATVVGVVLAFRKLADVANTFEERLDNLSALTGLTGRSLNWLGNQAKKSSVSVTETGVRIKQSANDIVDAYTKVGSQRPELLRNKEALHEVTQAAILLSEAAKGELSPATLALTTSMNQFNLGASEVNRIINTLAAGALIGAGEVPYLTEVLEKSGTTASLMGMSIEQSVGIIEAIAPKFQKARVAGTSLDRVLLKMSASGIGYKEGVFDMGRALEELDYKFKHGISSADLFGVEHAKMGEVLVMNRQLFKDYTLQVTGTDVAFKQAATNTDNMAAKLAQAKNRVTLMYIEVGQKLAPAVIFSTNTLNILLRTLMALPKILKDNKILITALVGALIAYRAEQLKDIAVTLYGNIAKAAEGVFIKMLVSQMRIRLAVTRAQALQTEKLTIVQKASAVAQYLLNAAMKANPVGLVVAGLTAIVVATMAIVKASKARKKADEGQRLSVSSVESSLKTLKKYYNEFEQSIEHLNRLRNDEKSSLLHYITLYTQLTEQTLAEDTRRRDKILKEHSKLSWYQHLFMTDEKQAEKATKKGLEFVSGMDNKLKDLAETLQNYKDQGLSLQSILNSEKTGDAIGTQTYDQLEEKLSSYTTALNASNIAGEDHVRLLKKIADVQDLMTKARGANLSGEEDKFKRDEVLADIDEFHARQINILKAQYARGLIEKENYLDLLDQEEIRFQLASIKRLKAYGQATAAEEGKITDTLISIHEEKAKQYEELMKSLDEQEKDMYKAWDDEYDTFMKTIDGDPHWTDSEKDKILEWNYWLENTEAGRRAKLEMDRKYRLAGETETNDKIVELSKVANEKKFQQLEDYARGVGTILDALGTMQQAAMNRELSAANLTDKQKKAIEVKYAKRQQAISIAQTIIEGVMEVARVNSNAGVNADLTQTLRAFLTGAAVIRTGAAVALIKSQQFAAGKYPVIGASDGRTYQANLMGSVKTGYYAKPTLGLFSEREPEIVIDGPTTRNIKANFPEILGAIQSARVKQYAGGMYPDLGGANEQSAMQITALLQANMQMMRQVILAHEKPGTVSFNSIRNLQEEYQAIKTKCTL